VIGKREQRLLHRITSERLARGEEEKNEEWGSGFVRG
jgi:hypothetical protein